MLKHADAAARGLMDIGQAAKESGVSVKMIRHYEAIGLMPAVKRTSAHYRLYGEKELHTLRFIKSARHVGLPLSDIRELLGLWQDRSTPCDSIRSLARKHIALLQARSRALSGMLRALDRLALGPDRKAGRSVLFNQTVRYQPRSLRTRGRHSPRETGISPRGPGGAAGPPRPAARRS